MVYFAVDYCQAVEVVTQKKSLRLREFELSDGEWAVLEELHGILKMRTR